METIKRTEGKWEHLHGTHSKSGFPIIGYRGKTGALYRIASICPEFPLTKEQAEANAAHIVKCVNTHNELVNTLQDCVKEFQCYDMQKETILLIDKIKNLIQLT